MIIITDAHISGARGNHVIFFKMLEGLEGNGQDLVFLGDIFDLWIALPKFEESIHRAFAAWCRQQKNHRSIGYMEGNHEYFLASERATDFTWCSSESWLRDDSGILFVHGDQINREDKNYLKFRKLAKNEISKFILRHLPFGPKITLLMKQQLKKTNTKFRLELPKVAIEEFGLVRFAEGVKIIFVGHFHRQDHFRNHDSKVLYLLPDWLSTQKITVYHRDSGEIRFIHWKELLT